MKDNKNNLVMYGLGLLTAFVIFSGYWLVNHWSALVMAASYPEVVSSLKVEKSFVVKK